MQNSALKEKIQKHPYVVSDIEKKSLDFLESVEDAGLEAEEYYTQMLYDEEFDSEIKGKADSYRRAMYNALKALKRMYFMSDEFYTRIKEVKRQRRKSFLIGSAPANAYIDETESSTGHFARGLNKYKLFYIFVFASVFGVLVETIWSIIREGHFERRVGLVYGPFNLLYGIGGVLLTVCLYKFRNRGDWLSFVGGMLVGTVVEYGCSWGQEFLFGSRSWDYSTYAFNLNGRVCLMYSVIWGFLGVLWMKNVYPRMAKWILKIPAKLGKIIATALAIFLAFDIIITSAAVSRWSDRVAGDTTPSNAYEQFIDERFPDERMRSIFINMKFKVKKP